MKFRKLVILTAMFFAGIPLMAQLGFQGGVALGSLKAKEDDESETFGSKVGFTFGGFYQMPLGQKFAF